MGGPPKQCGLVSFVLVNMATLAFIAAFLSLSGWLVPIEWFRLLVITASYLSLALIVLFFSSVALVPMLINAFLLNGVLLFDWKPAMIKGSWRLDLNPLCEVWVCFGMV